MKFKIGDKVKIKDIDSDKVWTIVNIDPDDDEFPYEAEHDGEHYVCEIFAEERLVAHNG